MINKEIILTRRAKILRNNMTPEEKQLWYHFLKDLPFTVNRQKVIGDYIVDFYCAEKKTVIEIDGEYHNVSFAIKRDKERDKYLRSLGLKIIRITNWQINNKFDNVCEKLERQFEL